MVNAHSRSQSRTVIVDMFDILIRKEQMKGLVGAVNMTKSISVK